MSFIDALATSAGVQLPPLGEEWPLFKELCLSHTLASNTVPDAWLAAAVRHHGDTLVTFDAGFRRLLRRSELLVLRGEG